MARGLPGAQPLEMTKWFDTNYHYLVPELDPGTRFRLAAAKPLAELAEAAQLGLATRPVLPGPVTFLLLGKAGPGAPAGFDRLSLLDPLLDVYAEMLAELAAGGCWPAWSTAATSGSTTWSGRSGCWRPCRAWPGRCWSPRPAPCCTSRSTWSRTAAWTRRCGPGWRSRARRSARWSPWPGG